MSAAPGVRAADPRELDRLAALYVELVRHHAGDPGFELAPSGEDAARAHLADALGEGDAAVLVRAGPGGIAGFVVARILRRGPLYRERARGEIEALFVRPDLRRGGVGRALAEAALAWMARRDVQRAAVQVAVGNPEGRAFWGALGFVPAMDVLERRL